MCIGYDHSWGRAKVNERRVRFRHETGSTYNMPDPIWYVRRQVQDYMELNTRSYLQAHAQRDPYYDIQ